MSKVDRIKKIVFVYFRDEILQAPKKVKEEMQTWENIGLINGLSGEDLEQLIEKTIDTTIRSANVPAEIIDQMLRKSGVRK